jgi:nitrite reductase/ring-hydroxylating ferredoxin subunit
MAWKKATSLEEIKENTITKIDCDGQKVLLINDEGQIYAVEHLCPHMNLPLQGGTIKESAIVCPWHRSAFDLTTGDVKAWSPWPPVVGKVLSNVRKEQALQVYDVKIENDVIFVDLPEDKS